jgi:hypothetical protein
MAEKIGKMKCKTTPPNKLKFFKIHFSLHKFRRHNTALGRHTAQQKHDMSKEKVLSKLRYL